VFVFCLNLDIFEFLNKMLRIVCHFECLLSLALCLLVFDNKSVLNKLIKIVGIPFLPLFPWLSSARPVSKAESVLVPARVEVPAAAEVALEVAAAVG
jgi:hypothetical protein